MLLPDSGTITKDMVASDGSPFHESFDFLQAMYSCFGD